MKGLKILSLLILTSGNILNLHGQTFHNLDFEQSCDSSQTGFCFWNLSWGGKGACVPEVFGKNKCLLITGKVEGAVGFAEQSSTLNKYPGLQIIQLSARINSDSVQGKGAGMNLGIYDSDNNLLVTKDMGYASLSWVTGTKAWKEYTFSAICPEGATKIKIGAILYGKGKARFDDFKVLLSPVAGRNPSALATKYISAVCDTIAKHSLVKDSININALKVVALQIAGQAKKYSDCYTAVEYLINSLRNYGDYHSFLMKHDEVITWKNDTSASANIIYAQSKIIDGCGYISVPHFAGGNAKLMLAFADTIQAALKKLDGSGIKGWLIDLRENTGGNMEPMIAGLGPLFSSEKLGSLIDVNNKPDSWYYKDGRYWGDGYEGWRVSNPVTLTSKLPIAVLTNAQTGSSGEIVAISFIDNANTKSFGQPTWGLTTGNGSFDLMDGARMMLASTIMADRNGKLYHGRISPVEIIEQSSDKKEDMAMMAAINWIGSKH
ncbi:MAG: S41 family peptidase [Bacteroidota bacterium]